MKRIIAVFLALIILSVPVLAVEEYAFKFEYTEGITLYNSENISSSDQNILGMDKAELHKYFKDNSILYLGVDNNSQFVFEITSQETDFSKGINDFKNIKENDIEDFADSMNFFSYSIEALGDGIYIVGEYLTDDSVNSPIVTQYVTVKQGQLYVITFNSSKVTSKDNLQRIKNVVSGITYIENDVPQKVSLLSVIGVAVLAVLIFCIALYILVTIIKDIRRRKE